ncbi:MAG TPA: hypothetical protein VLF94_01095 [Chlamydiales bacterium]|nr:hypothetical protein [Chlamydiales bacterium]
MKKMISSLAFLACCCIMGACAKSEEMKGRDANCKCPAGCHMKNEHCGCKTSCGCRGCK